MGNRHTPQQEAHAVSVTPGKRLQKAREHLNLSQEEVALRLRLSIQVVKAIEDDRYEGLNPTFVRGYVRSYARVVAIDPDSVVEIYNAIAAEVPPIQPCGSASVLQARSGDKLVKGVTYGLLAVLGVSILTWWQTRAPESMGPEVPLAVDPAPENLEPIPPQPIPGISEGVPTGGENPRRPDTPAPTGTLPTEPQQAVARAPADTAPPRAQATAPVPAAESPTPEPATVALVGNRRTLVMDLADDCWIDVIDGTGKRLYYDVARQGANVRLEGDPPFSVRLGRADTVTMSYAGKAVDFSAVARTGVARFKLGEDGVYR